MQVSLKTLSKILLTYTLVLLCLISCLKVDFIHSNPNHRSNYIFDEVGFFFFQESQDMINKRLRKQSDKIPVYLIVSQFFSLESNGQELESFIEDFLDEEKVTEGLLCVYNNDGQHLVLVPLGTFREVEKSDYKLLQNLSDLYQESKKNSFMDTFLTFIENVNGEYASKYQELIYEKNHR